MKYGIFLISLFIAVSAVAQPATVSSSEILLQLKKLEVNGAALYIAAHPDDENTRLISYLANEEKLRTGYLSLTRGDGGQNLIGSELGVELGLIRTQELLAARRTDGAEQFFTRAFDFGYSKTAEEAFEIWDKEKILHDAVWVIRKFKPDIIIARFPEDSRAGHGHHAASGIIAREAAIAAADPLKFTGQFQYGLQPWKVTRVLWNTFSFGRTSTISEDQFKIDAGAFNSLLGLGYGEISAQSRSQHKSQGFGVANSYGQAFEYFVPVWGAPPVNSLLDGIDISWENLQLSSIGKSIRKIINGFQHENPSASIPALVNIYSTIERQLQKEKDNRKKYWLQQKLTAIEKIIFQSSGIYAEAIADRQFAVTGDSLMVTLAIVNRGNQNFSSAKFIYNNREYPVENSKQNILFKIPVKHLVTEDATTTQPYWLRKPKAEGYFNIDDTTLTGTPENKDERVVLKIMYGDKEFSFPIPLQYKYTDPVIGEIRQSVVYHPRVQIKVSNNIVLTGTGKPPSPIQLLLIPAGDYGSKEVEFIFKNGSQAVSFQRTAVFRKNVPVSFNFSANEIYSGSSNATITPQAVIQWNNEKLSYSESVSQIQYGHIPEISYLKKEEINFITEEIKITDRNIGYIQGAGDRVGEALSAMGFSVTYLSEADINLPALQKFDAIVTGIRAYNTASWLLNYYSVLMQYVQEGGNLIMQYNTSLPASQIASAISPHPFVIGRNRVTEESSPVKLLLPNHQVLNYPNKISENDFKGWVQERGLYFAQNFGSEFSTPLGMADKEEDILNGSLIIADYGKGKFVYTGIAFFRQTPAAVPGAYKLLANIVCLNLKPVEANE